MITYLRLNAGHTRMGNPRRIFLIYQDGDLIETLDEGYCGYGEIRERAKKVQMIDMGTLATTPKQYRELLKFKKK